MNDSGALLSLGLALALLLLWCLGALGGKVLRRWRQGRVNRDRWMKLLK